MDDADRAEIRAAFDIAAGQQEMANAVLGNVQNILINLVSQFALVKEALHPALLAGLSESAAAQLQDLELGIREQMSAFLIELDRINRQRPKGEGPQPSGK